MSTMERILRLMGEKKASDVYLSAHAPALIKINGQCLPINNQLLPPDARTEVPFSFLILRDGRVIFDGDLKELRETRDEYIREYIS